MLASYQRQTCACAWMCGVTVLGEVKGAWKMKGRVGKREKRDIVEMCSP